MKWLKILLALAEILIPGLAMLGKNRLCDELTIAKGVITVLGKDKTPEEKGRVIEEVIGDLKAVKKFKKRVGKKLDKAKNRLWKKIF